MTNVSRRLNKELYDIQNDPPMNISAGPMNDNIFEWEAVLLGPSETPYEGGVFKLDIHIPKDYPMKPPNIIFKTKIYHPNSVHFFYNGFVKIIFYKVKHKYV